LLLEYRGQGKGEPERQHDVDKNKKVNMRWTKMSIFSIGLAKVCFLAKPTFR
jgi:hypothetical protein